MYKAITVFIIAFAAICASAQTPSKQEPISQTEFVKMLYALEASPGKKAEFVEELRIRGIGFALTSGLRSLAASKSANDAEFRRTLEEANRRRENPAASQLPDAGEAAAALENTRTATLAAVDDMPDFVVKQRIRRSIAFAGTGNFTSRDHLVVGVSYRASGQEEYQLLSINGVVQTDTKSKDSYSEAGGTSSTGEFVSVLDTVFKPESDTRFEVVDTDVIRGRRTIVFNYSITRDKARQQITSLSFVPDSTISGMRGRIWIDREKFRVLRLESIATEIPSDFPVTAASRLIDYDWVTINDEQYLLPSVSDVRLTFRQGKESYESRNVIQFRDYQKFGTEVIITDEDDVVIPEEGADTPPPLRKDGPPPLPKAPPLP